MKKKNLSVKKKIHNFYYKKLEDPRIKKQMLYMGEFKVLIDLF